MSRLQELILTRLAALGESGSPMSYREAARRSRGGFSVTNLSDIITGRHRGALGDRVARGLADALEVPLKDVYEAAAVPMPHSRWVLPEEFDRLTPTQRRLMEDMGFALLEAYNRGRRDATGQ